MDDQDEIGIEKLRVDPALMQRVLEQQARKSKRKGWQRIYTRGAEGMGAAAAGGKTDQHLPPGDRAALPALVRQRKAGHRFQQGGAGGKNLCSIEMGSPRRTGTAGPDRGGSQAAQVAARRPAPHPDKTNMSAIAHSHMRASAPEIPGNMRAIAPKGSLFSFLVLLLRFSIYLVRDTPTCMSLARVKQKPSSRHLLRGTRAPRLDPDQGHPNERRNRGHSPVGTTSLYCV